MQTQENTLTEIESLGLKSSYNFADGHAYQDLAQTQVSIINRLNEIWFESSARKVHEVEKIYKTAFARLAESPSLEDYNYFKISPTASNSIDIAAAWLAEKNLRVGLLEPTFDNLYLLLKRRGVKVSSLDESLLHAGEIQSTVCATEVDAIFLVNPNNPTGRQLTKELFLEIISHCVKSKKVLLLDNTFRFFVESEFDQYQILIDSGVSFLSIEDTGKVWPTQDMKASLIFYSKDIAKEVEIIYEEIYLCVSNFTLTVLTQFLNDAKTRGLHDAVWAEVENRRKVFRQSIQDSILEIDPISKNSKLSVEWVRIHSILQSDYEVMAYFRKKELILLPGRNFYWSGREDQTRNIRFSFLKPKNQFLSAVNALSLGLKELTK